MSVSRNRESFKIGLVELPYVTLLDSDGTDMLETYIDIPLISKQILMASLIKGGFGARLVDMRGTGMEEFGAATWNGRELRKVFLGRKIRELDPDAYDAWGITSNYMQNREASCIAVSHLSKTGRPVIVGGSDAIAVPEVYLKAGAKAVITDKSGASNLTLLDYLLKIPVKEDLTGVILSDGRIFKNPARPMSPEDWPVPSADLIRECLGFGGSHMLQMLEKSVLYNSTMFDIGCDRKCDFCMTPTYGLGYKRMMPETALEWCSVSKQAGAKIIVCDSDQFLGRVNYKNGKEEVAELMAGLREMELPIVWGNGTDLKKLTVDYGKGKENLLIKDEKLIRTMFEPNSKGGCFGTYIPAERPLLNRESYTKLLPWNHHCEVVKAIAGTGIPNIAYAVIIGFPDDSHESLLHLEEAVYGLYEEVKRVSPSTNFISWPLTITPIPGTPMAERLEKMGLCPFKDEPLINGAFRLASVNTHYMSYDEVYSWRLRLMKIGDMSFDLRKYKEDSEE